MGGGDIEALGEITIDEQSPDEDERQAMQVLRDPEQNIVIDEQSPDEDERQAMQNLRAPIRRKAKNIIHSGLSLNIYILYLLLMVNLNIEDDEDEESYSVLEIHHQKNRTIRPPDPHSLGHKQFEAIP